MYTDLFEIKEYSHVYIVNQRDVFSESRDVSLGLMYEHKCCCSVSAFCLAKPLLGNPMQHYKSNVRLGYGSTKSAKNSKVKGYCTSV